MRRVELEEYLELAEQIKYALDQEDADDDIFKGTFEHNDIQLTVEFVVYRTYERNYDMDRYVIYDLVPLWAECRTFDVVGELIENDFVWYKLRSTLRRVIETLR